MMLGQIMAGYSLGDADLRIRKVIAKKIVDKIPEVRNEFIYGKKSIYKFDKKLNKDVYVGISEEDSPLCVGAVRNGFSEELAVKIFDQMEAFASYAFNKSHSACYGLLAFKTAWLSYYYPVEWTVACLTLDSADANAKDKITASLNSCKKRGIKILPPDINKSDTGFTVALLDNSEKAVRYGFLAIKDVGAGICELISKLIDMDGEFESFYDFLDRTVGKNNGTLRKLLIGMGKLEVKIKDGKEVKSLRIPFTKRNIVPLILSGAFDNLEDNRHKLFNDYIKYKKDKTELKDEDKFNVKEKLEYELEYLGYYVSQHPLDGPAFPYVDVNSIPDNYSVTLAGLFKDITTAYIKKGKNKGQKFYKIRMETKDGSMVNVNIFKSVYDKHPECIKGLNGKRAKEGKEIIIVKGKYNSEYNNINAYEILKVRGASDLIDEEDDVAVDNYKQLELEPKVNPMDEDLMFKVD